MTLAFLTSACGWLSMEQGAGLAGPVLAGWAGQSNGVSTNNVLLVQIEGPVWYTIYRHLPVVKGVNKPLYLSTNQWEKDIYALILQKLWGRSNGHVVSRRRKKTTWIRGNLQHSWRGYRNKGGRWFPHQTEVGQTMLVLSTLKNIGHFGYVLIIMPHRIDTKSMFETNSVWYCSKVW